jgi:hypothetical protein
MSLLKPKISWWKVGLTIRPQLFWKVDKIKL